MEASEKIILALDTPTGHDALALLKTLDRAIQFVKIGPALFVQEGKTLVAELQSQGYRIFLDLKLHDIPNTVALGVRAAKELGVWMLSIHLSGGSKMLEAAARESQGKPILAGITVLTSLDDENLEEIGFSKSVDEHVKRLSLLGAKAGIGTMVASPKEVRMLRAALGNTVKLVTPGIRLEDAPPDDQSRTMTPREAIEAGADYLVIGRPILQVRNPKETLASIAASIEKAKNRNCP